MELTKRASRRSASWSWPRRMSFASRRRFSGTGGFGAGLAVALVEHHLLGVVGPAFDVGVGAENFADGGGELRRPEELDVVAGVGLVDAGGDDGADVEGGHVLGDVRRGPGFFRQGDVEVGLGGVGFEGAGRVHGCLGGGAHEGRGLFEGGLDFGGDGDDVVGVDEGDEAGEGVLKCVEEFVGRGVDGG